MDDAAHHTEESGAIAAGAVLIIAGLLGVVLLATSSDLLLSDDLEPVARKVEEEGNRGFYTLIVFWAIMIALATAGLAAVAAVLARAGGAARALGAAAGTLAGISGAPLVMVPAVYSALVNRWDSDTESDAMSEGGYAVEVLESIPFGASQAGFGILLVSLLALAAAFFTSDEMAGAIGIAPLVLSFFTIAVLEEGQGVSNVFLPVIALIIGIPVLWYGWAMRRQRSRPGIRSLDPS